MREETIKLYSFVELSNNAKEKAIQKHWDINVDFNWYDTTYCEMKECGVIVKNFDCNRQDINISLKFDHYKVAEKLINYFDPKDVYFADEFISLCDDIYSKIETPSDYEDCPEEFPESSEFDCQFDQLMNEYEREFFLELKSFILTRLTNEYEYFTSEEAIIETIISNKYEFLEDGTLY